MKISNIKYVIYLILLTSCGKTDTEYGESNIIVNVDGIIDYSGLNPIFEYKDNDQHIWQGLGLKKLTKDSIKFVLVIKGDSCESHFTGYAINSSSNGDPEIDNSNETFSSTEYVTESKQYIMRIRISLEKDRAKIYYQGKDGEKINCLTPLDKVLRTENAR